MIKIGILSSSRADFGIYLPLLKAVQKEKDIDCTIIAFGTHLSKFHGYTVETIKNEGFSKIHTIESLLIGDTSNAISSSYALTALKFSEYWSLNQDYDVVFALGDRFEMAAAVASSIPFNITCAHLHGGETTLGAIDNIYRHSITLASKIHFVSTNLFKERVRNLTDDVKHIYNIGSLSLENLLTVKLLTFAEFYEKWGIDLTIDTILVTVHPETVNFQKNELFADELINSLTDLSKDYQIVVTMPNADTAGVIYRQRLVDLASKIKNIKLIENFGTQSYFTCMKYAKLVLGNSSSGIVEAASFNKYVINIGDRQKGRLTNANVIHVPFESESIVSNAVKYAKMNYTGENLYFQPNPSKEILAIIKEIYAALL